MAHSCRRELCLDSGERLRLHENIKVLIESAGLEHAGPGVAARLGMVYHSANLVGYKPLLERFLSKKNANVSHSQPHRILVQP